MKKKGGLKAPKPGGMMSRGSKSKGKPHPMGMPKGPKGPDGKGGKIR